MNLFFSLIAKLVSSPWVQAVLVPALKGLIVDFFESVAKKQEAKGAKAAVQAAQTAEELRDAASKIRALMARRK